MKRTPLITFLVILIVAIIGSACVGGMDTAFSPKLYVVRVEDKIITKGIYNAKVIIEAKGISKISDLTDSDGYVRLSIPTEYVGKPGRLIVEVDGYQTYRSEINLNVDQLPARVLLEKVETTTVPPITLTFAPVADTPTPTELPGKIKDSMRVEMVLIPAGEFQMGSEKGASDEKPVHTVYLDDFYIGMYEVTNALYADCVDAEVCPPPAWDSSPTRSSYFGDPLYEKYPVIYVTWDQAEAYCEWKGARLPTEAEWEKAGRGGLESKEYPWGDETPSCEKKALNGANSSDCGRQDTEEVGSYSSNGYGLYDMAGNVWEYVQDWYSSNFYASQIPLHNPFNSIATTDRVVRGGSWAFPSIFLRVADRFWGPPHAPDSITIDNNIRSIGFRCARSP